MRCFLPRAVYLVPCESHSDQPCSTELNYHYLTRFCPGAAVAVYVMTRDRWVSPKI